MAENVIFPQLSALNWPSNILQVWLTLHALGVPEQHIRLIPSFGHYAVPEVTEEASADFSGGGDKLPSDRLQGPHLDPRTRRLTIHAVDPSQIRPRLKVNIRQDTVTHFLPASLDQEARLHEETVGRLAHFVEPLLGGLPTDTDETRDLPTPEDPLSAIIRQVCARYPELTATIPPGIRSVLETVLERLEEVFAEADIDARRQRLRETVNSFYEQPDIPHLGRSLAPGVHLMLTRQPADPDVCRSIFALMAAKLALQPEDGVSIDQARIAIGYFERWGHALFGGNPTARTDALEHLLKDLREEDFHGQWHLFRRLRVALSRETREERERVVRELLEIMTTEVFSAVAVSDLLWGFGWIHGPLSDARANESPLRHDGCLIAVTGGLNHRALLLTQARRWSEQGGFCGVKVTEAPEHLGNTSSRETLDLSVLEECERVELWALVTQRRDTADPLILLEVAAKRLVHPDVIICLRRYAQAPCEMGTLLAQPQSSGGLGGTAVLGSLALFQYPGIVVLIPLSEGAEAEAGRAKAVMRILERLFVPVTCQIEIVWQEALARLDGGSYLRHDFQRGVRLADPWTALTDGVNETPESAVP